MKKATKLLGIAALAAVIGFGLAGCDGGSDDNGDKMYTVSFNSNGGIGAVPVAITQAYIGDSIMLPPGIGLERTGFLFGGWNLRADGTGTNFFPGDWFTPDANTTLYAQWNVNSGGGAKSVMVGTQIGTITPGTAGTATFTVTTSNIADGSYPAVVADLPLGVTVSGDVYISGNSGTLRLAVSTAAAFGTTSTLTLTIDGTTSAEFTLTIGSEIGSPPSLSDYFGFWRSGSGINTPTYEISSAKIGWAGREYNLTSVIAAEPNQNELNKAEFPSGFVFNSSGGVRTLYLSTNKARFLDADGSVIYTRQVPIAITLDANGGSGTVPDVITYPWVSIELPETSLTKTGYALVSWNTEADGTGTNYNISNYNTGYYHWFSNDTTLYARWLPAYTYTFNANGGNGTAPAAITGASITFPEGTGLTKTGFIFGGWNTKADGTGTNYNAGSSFTPTADVTLYVKWYNWPWDNLPPDNTLTLLSDGRSVRKSISSNKEDWFFFTATASEQYIDVYRNFIIGYLDVQLYDSTCNAIGYKHTVPASEWSPSFHSWSVSVTSGETYYIKVLHNFSAWSSENSYSISVSVKEQ